MLPAGIRSQASISSPCQSLSPSRWLNATSTISCMSVPILVTPVRCHLAPHSRLSPDCKLPLPDALRPVPCLRIWTGVRRIPGTLYCCHRCLGRIPKVGQPYHPLPSASAVNADLPGFPEPRHYLLNPQLHFHVCLSFHKVTHSDRMRLPVDSPAAAGPPLPLDGLPPLPSRSPAWPNANTK